MPKLGQSIATEVQEKLSQMAEGSRTPVETEGAGAKTGERVALFVDGENLIPRFGMNPGFRLHFGRLRDLLAADRSVNLARWFDSYKDNGERERKERLYLALSLSGFTVRALPLRNGYKLKSRIDPYLQAEISERLLLEEGGEEPYTHTFILASGDSDFYPIIDLLKRHGRRVEVAYLGNTLSHELRAAADRLIDLREHLGEIAFDRKGSRNGNGNGDKLGPVKVMAAGRSHGSPSVAVTVVPSRRTRLKRYLRGLKARILKD